MKTTVRWRLGLAAVLLAAGCGRGKSIVPRYPLDGSFGIRGLVIAPVGQDDDNAYAIAIQSDGKIVVAGSADEDVGNNPHFAVASYNSDGSLDNTFSMDGIVISQVGAWRDRAYAVGVQADGKIVAAGYANDGSDSDVALVRYGADGSLDSSFDSDGIVTTDLGSTSDIVYALAIQNDGKIVVAGVTHNGVDSDFALARYDENGGLDTGFDTDGIVTTDVGGTTDYAQAIAIQNDGKIIVAGLFDNGTDSDFALVRYNPNGSLDIGFDLDGIVTTDFGIGNDYARSIAIQNDGKIIVGGDSGNDLAFTDFLLARYNTDGSLDTSFGVDGNTLTDFVGIYDAANALAIQADGKIIAAGYSQHVEWPLGFHYPIGVSDLAVARYNADGSLDVSFNWSGKVTTDLGGNGALITALSIDSDGKIVAAGYGDDDGYDSDFILARYLP